MPGYVSKNLRCARSVQAISSSARHSLFCAGAADVRVVDRIHLICRRLVRNQFTQVPPSAPGATLHCKPLQQSAFVVHAAAEGMQEVAAHRRMPPASGTHGTALQQSTEDAQTWPAIA